MRFQRQYQGTDNIFVSGTVTANNIYFSILNSKEIQHLFNYSLVENLSLIQNHDGNILIAEIDN